jgi:hypothetical protein
VLPRFSGYTEENEENKSIKHTHPSIDFNLIEQGTCSQLSSRESSNFRPIAVDILPARPRCDGELKVCREPPYIERDRKEHIYATEHKQSDVMIIAGASSRRGNDRPDLSSSGPNAIHIEA